MSPSIPGLLWDLGFLALPCGHPGTSLLDPGASLVVPGLLGTFRTGIFSSYLVGHPGMSLIVSGFLGLPGTSETEVPRL